MLNHVEEIISWLCRCPHRRAGEGGRGMGSVGISCVKLLTS